jgi:hypothetical protein
MLLVGASFQTRGIPERAGLLRPFDAVLGPRGGGTFFEARTSEDNFDILNSGTTSY